MLGELGSGPLREEERRRLLHEGVGAAATSAFVEVHFDNSDGHYPVEGKTGVVRREISLKKDQYVLDGRNVTKTEVPTMLESVGLSRTNPTHFVRQGRVTALTTMRDEQRLDMLHEISGTATYDARREDSVKIMHEAGQQKQRIIESIAVIETRLKRLDEEKAELNKYRTLERQKKAAEHTYYSRESKRWQSEIHKHESEAEKKAAASVTLEDELNETTEAVTRTEAELVATTESVHTQQREVAAKNSARGSLVKEVTRLELSVQQAAADAARHEEAVVEVRDELVCLDRRVEEVRAELAASEPKREAAADAADAAEKARTSCESEMQTLYARQDEGQR